MTAERPQARAPRRGLAIASLVLGILSIPTLGLLLVGAMLGIAFGVAALVKAGRQPDEYGGKGLAIAGLVASAFSIVVMPVVIGIVAAIAIPSFLRARVSANESTALADINTVVLAEASYAASNGGFFDRLECVEAPATCIRGYSGKSSFIEAIPASRSGYVRSFHPGPPPPSDAIGRPGVSPSSLTSFAFTAVPETQGQTGVRGFCGDAKGQLCMTPDGRPPAIVEGLCVKLDVPARSELAVCAAADPEEP